MSTVAILIDGGFFHKRAQYLWGDAEPEKRAEELCIYCKKHLTKHDHLYRIFYYDCPPSDKKVYHPLLKKQIDLSKTDQYRWMTDFQSIMKKKRKVALRMGHLLEIGVFYTLKPEIVKKICHGNKSLDDLSESDFFLSISQKGVDMKIGVDIASMAYKKQANKMILISGDSDFVPAAKLARREGVDFVLDPMGASIRDDLSEHIDGLISPHFVPKKNEIMKEMESETNDYFD